LDEADYVEINKSVVFGTNYYGPMEIRYCDTCKAKVSNIGQDPHLKIGEALAFDELNFPHRLPLKLCSVSGNYLISP